MVPNGQGLRQMMITIKREGDDWAEGIDRSETIVRECTLLGTGDRRPDQGRRHRRHGRRDVPHARETLDSSREKGRIADYQR